MFVSEKIIMHYSQQIRVAAHTVHHGGVIAYPTEGVFGLGCDPFNDDAVSQILTLKSRPVEKGVILIASHVSQLLPFLADLSSEQWLQLNTTWPGPYTWVIPHNGSLPYWITGGRPTIAVRVTSHPIARALCTAIQFPLVSTSANRTTRPALTTALHVHREFGNEVDFIVGGRVQTPGQASQIRDLTTGHQFRS